MPTASGTRMLIATSFATTIGAMPSVKVVKSFRRRSDAGMMAMASTPDAVSSETANGRLPPTLIAFPGITGGTGESESRTMAIFTPGASGSLVANSTAMSGTSTCIDSTERASSPGDRSSHVASRHDDVMPIETTTANRLTLIDSSDSVSMVIVWHPVSWWSRARPDVEARRARKIVPSGRCHRVADGRTHARKEEGGPSLDPLIVRAMVCRTLWLGGVRLGVRAECCRMPRLTRILTSTRRLAARPSAVSLLPTGCVVPRPAGLTIFRSGTLCVPET